MTASENTPAGHGPAGRDRLARALREARSGAGISGVRAGRAAGMSQSKISKIERGLLLPSVDDVAALCRVYGVGEGERDDVLVLTEALHAEASTRVIMARGVSQTQQRIARLEADTSLVRSFQPLIVLGVLQTQEYAECLFRTPLYDLPEDEIEASVRSRQERRRSLPDASGEYRLIMTEGALRWQAGSASVMAEQIREIAKAVARGGNTSVGVIPWSTPVDVFPRNAFTIYDRDAVMVGTETATATITGASDIASYVRLFERLEALASFGDEAVGHLERIEADYRRL